MIRSRLEKLREWMAAEGVEAFIVPSNDPHFSEYVAPHWACRAWISGFDGSAGTVVVTRKGAALWTDSRYFLQAEAQLDGSGIELQRMGLVGTPEVMEWLAAQSDVRRIGIDGRLFSHRAFLRLADEAAERGMTLVDCSDPFDTIWDGRPDIPAEPATILEERYSGESTRSKLQRIRALGDGKPEEAVRLVAVLDEIAWTLNIRGTDIEYNPLVISYLSVEPERALLFTAPERFGPREREQLAAEGVEVRAYEAFDAYLATLANRPVVVHPEGLDQFHYAALEAAGARIEEETTPYSSTALLKAVKNPTEIDGFRRAMEVDGAALVRFERWLEQTVEAGERPTEREITDRLHAFRTADPDFHGESFETIAGYGSHGAIVHYAVSEESDRAIGTDSFLLIDSGGQYPFGTTDITRTYHFSTPTEEQRRDYTAVLRGMIDLSAAQFPTGTRGTQLDVLARRHLWQAGLNYLHGTGHGVGHCLCVHEGPQSIRMNENPVTLQPGMVQSCEPGLYLTGRHGIRIENLTLVTEEGCPTGFLRFEPLTLCPISLRAVETAALDADQRDWLNRYHAAVYERLSPRLTPEERAWLAEKTRPI
ncbi:aminopeptidase P family protein [uncultured Rikenella sp.]|mgnify:CR=1 FL=1|uniref:aminopeptidase P family protein n=1 Tax=uncultured Rikenella sp. TaxID=368003 RepID=UPI002607672D|nr:aminopeptidase P family protein [uncultured Rikenella sp.]